MPSDQSFIQQLVESNCEDVFSYLGQHKTDSGMTIRCFLPDANKVSVVDSDSDKVIAEMSSQHEAGVFSADVPEKISRYHFSAVFSDAVVRIDDPYRFCTTIDEKDLYLFGEGTHERIYEVLGAHLMAIDGVAGCRFSVWAPNASRVSVVGDFNFWDGRKHMMRKLIPSGVWEIFIPGVSEGALYQFELKEKNGNLLPRKSDPYGVLSQAPPATASIVFDRGSYQWNDDAWLAKQDGEASYTQAISIYELHVGSWRRVPEENNRFLNYRELAEYLIPYILEMGFTHIQLMPVSEFPFNGSWGYQPIGMYAPTSRFGDPNALKYFIDQCHQNNIAVLIDWVPGHFPNDDHGLHRFDGSPLYEHADPRRGFHPDWNTHIYNYGRKEVSNFLMANALYWMDQFHIDGLRVDAVASMLYLDYSRKEGEWLPNAFGGRENLEAIDFIRDTNERVYANFPNTMMVAEESTSWPGVTKPTDSGGLGFGYKWNMGWMNDSLDYMSKDALYRKYHHHDMTFSLYYAFSENFILPLSHDEVVHEKGSILEKMPGDTWQKFANVRAYYGFMWGHPGKKLLFMGNEFAQGPEWDHDNSLCWHQLHIKEHEGVQTLVRDLNHLYKTTPALYENDTDEKGFEWIEADDSQNSVFTFIRKASNDDSFMIVVANFTPIPCDNYRIGVKNAGVYKECLNTDDVCYGGAGRTNSGELRSENHPWHYRQQSIVVDIPPLATLFLSLNPGE